MSLVVNTWALLLLRGATTLQTLKAEQYLCDWAFLQRVHIPICHLFWSFVSVFVMSPHMPLAHTITAAGGEQKMGVM